MQNREGRWPGIGAAVAALFVGALWGQPAASQTSEGAARDAARDATEQQRAQQRETQQREQLLPSREVRPGGPEPTPVQRLPQDETPCFPIQQIELRGQEAARFGWLIDALTAPDGLDGPLRRCLGATGIGVVAQRAQNALIERGFVTSRVLVEPQDLSQGQLLLTLMPGRIRQIRFTEPAGRANAWNALRAQPGDVLNLRDIEQALENFKRVPTVEADIQIEPGDEPGQSDLLIRWTQSRPLRLNFSVDDSGSPGTGKYQGSATLSVDHPLALNDLFYVSVQGDLGGGDPGERGTHGRSLHYSLPWGRTLLAFDTSRNRYLQTVAGASQDYAYRGDSASQEITLSALVHRDSTSKTTVHAKAFARQSLNFIDDTEIEVQRRRVGGWQLGVGHRAALGKATLDLNLNHRRGTGAFGSLPAPEEAFGEGTSRFALTQASAQWQWPFTVGAQPWQISSLWRAQFNRTPLAPQERFAIGGRYTVRGFDGESSLSAESGWIWRNELSTPVAETGSSLFLGLDHGEVSGPSAQSLVGKRLTGAVVGLRGALGAVQYELFTGWPLHKPEGFRTSNATAGFWLSASF